MYDSDLEAYLLNNAQYEQLVANFGSDGWEDWGTEDGKHVVNIWDDAILEALGLGSYSGGGIDINASHQGGPM